MRIKVRIDNTTHASVDAFAARRRRMDWPTDPVRPGDDPEYILDCCFYDGTTKPDDQDDSGFGVVDYWKIFSGDPITANHTSDDGFTFQFFQNASALDVDEFLKDWDGAETGREYGIFDRQPMERITYADFVFNGEVIPVGVRKPNIQVELLYPEDKSVAVTVDLKRIFRGGVVGATADTLIDDTTKTGYRIYSPPLTVGHLRCKEITFNSVICHAGAAFGPGDSVVKQQVYSELEGVAWLPFDTSDEDNYKLTKTPNYNDEAFTEPPVRMISQFTQLRIITMPRRWWVWVREKVAGGSGGVKVWGVWVKPDRNFEMPTPRKQGNWELAHCWHYGDSRPPDDESEQAYLMERNAHALFDFTGFGGGADNDDRNAFYMIYTYNSMANNGILWGAMDTLHHASYPPGTGELGDWDEIIWNFWKWQRLGDMSNNTVWGPGDEGDKFHPRGTMGVFSCMPDLKTPLLFGERSFRPLDEGSEPVGFTRYIKAYKDEGFNTTGRQAKEDLLAYVLDCLAGMDANPPDAENVASWGICVAGAKEGDLVAVLECGDGQPIYVWRKTEEVPKPDYDHTFDYPNSCYFYISIPDAVQFSGHYIASGLNTEFVNCRGFIEWPFSVEQTGGSYYDKRWIFNRVIRNWGSWFNVHQNEDDSLIMIPHRSTIALDYPVSLIAYFGELP